MNKEAPRIRLIISDALASAVSLQNSLIGLPKGKFSTDDEEATSKFIQARGRSEGKFLDICNWLRR
ncbi:putative actin patch assembly and actin polymerization protein, partial [Fusarium falciforme]